MMKIEQMFANQSEIIVKKKKQQGHQQNERKDARSRFFSHQIESKLNQANVTEEEQQQIISLFMEQQHKIDLYRLEKQIAKHRKVIQQLNKILEQIEERYHRKQRQCLPMQQIITNNFSTIQVIHIQYQQNQFDQCCYSISAFELFKVVHINKLLHQVIIKGVKVQQFQQFTKLYRIMDRELSEQMETTNELSWIGNFSPPKSLKLSIDAQLLFDMKNRDRDYTLSRINDLVFFRKLPFQLSDIVIKVRLGQWHQANQILHKLWECLKEIKKINIVICGNPYYQMTTSQVGIVRSALFGGLASLTEISHLSFNCKSFSSVGINDFLAMEQSLRTLFNNNAVTHLKLEYCFNIPVFPQINSLQLIQLNGLSFRKQVRFMEKVARNNPSLRCIQNSWINQEWGINGQLFNQLQTLIIYYCNRIFISDISSQSPSKIKKLSIEESIIGRISFLSVVFPKLVNLTSLSLNGIDFGHQLLCMIPSPHLEELSISNNSAIIHLKTIDSKWPDLSIIKLQNCSNLSWSICEFKGLTRLQVNKEMWKKDNKLLIDIMKMRGIIVSSW